MIYTIYMMDEPVVSDSPTGDSSFFGESVVPGDVVSDSSADGKGGRGVAWERGGRVSLWRSGRAVWVLALVGMLGLVVGYVLGAVVLSPEQAAGPAPVEGLITAKVEARQITATVVARADVQFADRVAVSPPVPEGAVAAVVTGQVPVVGSLVGAGDVVLEVSGRPVFVLQGAFPSYRSLGAGMSGVDVTELRAALNGLGLGAGPESVSYDAALAGAVRALYERAGYPASDGGDTAAQQVRAAQDAVTDTSSGVTQATSGVAQAQKLAAQARNNVVAAQSDYDAAVAAQQSGGGASTEPGADTALTVQQAKSALDQARGAVDQADLGVGQANDSLAAAQRGLARAQEALADAQRAAWATVPVGAVVFVPDLPRRVDEVNVTVGDDLASLAAQTGSTAPVAPVVLSSAQITVTAQVEMDQAALLAVGGPADLAVPGGGVVSGRIGSICDLTSAAGQTSRCAVGITLPDPGAAGVSDLVGNVQVTMVVGTSSPDSLIVPVAAVSADTAGNARVTVVDGQLQPGVAARDQKTTVVQVETGLSAEGMVEITRATPSISAGDLVVIGQGTIQASSTPTPR